MSTLRCSYPALISAALLVSGGCDPSSIEREASDSTRAPDAGETQDGKRSTAPDASRPDLGASGAGMNSAENSSGAGGAANANTRGAAGAGSAGTRGTPAADGGVDGAVSGNEDADDAGTSGAGGDSMARVQPGLYLAKAFYFIVRADGSVTDFTYHVQYPLCPSGTANSTTTSFRPFQIEHEQLNVTSPSGRSGYDVSCDFDTSKASCTIAWRVQRDRCAMPEYSDTISDVAVLQADQCDFGGPMTSTVAAPDADGHVDVEVRVLPWGADACQGTVVPDGTEVRFSAFSGASVEPKSAMTVAGVVHATVSATGTATSATLFVELDGPLHEPHQGTPISVQF